MITIKDISTQELLTSISGKRYNDITNDEEEIFVGFRLVPGGTVEMPMSESVYATRTEIKAELALRPHVSNKAEGKLIRKLMAQTGQSEEWLRAHPRYGQEIFEIGNCNGKKRKTISKESYVEASKYYTKPSMEYRYKIGKVRGDKK